MSENSAANAQLEAAMLDFKKMRLGILEIDYPFTDEQEVFILESDGMIVPMKWHATPYQCMMHHTAWSFSMQRLHLLLGINDCYWYQSMNSERCAMRAGSRPLVELVCRMLSRSGTSVF